MRRPLIAALVLLAFAVSAQAAVVVTDKPEVKKEGAQGITDAWHDVDIDTQAAKYTVRYNSSCGPDGKLVRAKDDMVLSGLGLGPNTANWRLKGSGFLGLLVNGQPVLASNKAEMAVLGQGQKGIVNLAWKHDMADVSMRIVAADQDDKLMCEISLEPKTQVNTIELRLMCYPYYYYDMADPEKKASDRWIATATRSAQHDATIKLGPEETWVYYYDGRITFGGPAALMLQPVEGTKTRVDVWQSSVMTSIAYPAGTKKIRFALWEFAQGVTWQDGLERMKNQAEKAGADLQKEDFQPAKKITIEAK